MNPIQLTYLLVYVPISTNKDTNLTPSLSATPSLAHSPASSPVASNISPGQADSSQPHHRCRGSLLPNSLFQATTDSATASSS